MPREGTPDLELHALGLLVADEQTVLILHEADNRVVEVIAADRQRGRDDNPAERDHGHLARAAAHVDDERGDGVLDRQAGADRSGHRLLDQVRLSRARRERCLHDGVALDLRQPAGDADDDRAAEPAAADPADEVAKHLLGRLEVCDHAVAQGPGGDDRRRRAPQHLPRLLPDGVDLTGLLVHRHHRGLEQDDALAAAEDDGVRRPEVDGQIGTGDERGQSHACSFAASTSRHRARPQRTGKP